MVAEEKIMLSDDPQNLMDKPALIKTISDNSYNMTEIVDLFHKGFIIPVDEGEKLYHAGISLNFLNFQKKLEIMGLSVKLQRKIAEMYYPLCWAMVTDIEYELKAFKEEKGRDPSKMELAYLRVINEWATANMMGNIEQRIIKLDSEGNEELEQMIEEAAQKRKTLKKKATFGYQENQVKKLIKEVWQFPLLFYQGREIKAFINIDSISCNNDEKKLLWGGHFDFSLCDKNGFLQLVVEYNGAGHYGNSEEEKQAACARDNSKKRVCAKAGFPLVVLTAEFALLDNYKKIFSKFLRIFKEKQKDIDLKTLHDMVAEPLNYADAKHILTLMNKMGQSGIDSAFQRLRIYEIQERIDLLLALLWELYATLEDFAKLDSSLDTLRNRSI